MLTVIGRNAIVMGSLAIAAGWMGWSPRWRVRWASLLVVAAVAAGAWLEVLGPRDLLALPTDAGLGHPLALVLAWAAFAGAARAAGRAWLPGPPLLVAIISGALLGELGGAAVLAAGARDRRAAARLALAAAGGALVGRAGDPAVLVLGEAGLPWVMAPLGVAMALVAAPRRDDLASAAGDKLVTAVGLAVAAAALVPGLALGALTVGMIALAWRARLRGLDSGPLTWTVASAALALMATAGGTPEMIAMGIERFQEQLGAIALPALTGVGLVLSMALDGAAGALVGQAVLDRALSMHVEGGREALLLGLAAGGLGPLVVAGAVREGLGRWALQALLAVLGAALLL